MFIRLCIFQRSLETNCSWFKQKALDADPRAIQQIVLQGVVGGDKNTKRRLYTINEQSEETMLEFSKGTAKVL